MRNRDKFFMVPNGFADNVLRDLSPKALKVYVVLARMRNTKTKDCFPSFKTIAERSGISKRRVSDAVNELVAKRCIRRRKALGKSNNYALTSVEKRHEGNADIVQQPVSNLSETRVDVVPYNDTVNETSNNTSLTRSLHKIEQLQEGEDFQISSSDYTSLADACLGTVVPLVTTASACAPADRGDKSVPVTEGIRIDQHSGISEQGMDTGVTALALPALAEKPAKRLRSIQEIRKEHPDAERDSCGTLAQAVWFEGTRMGHEQCL